MADPQTDPAETVRKLNQAFGGSDHPPQFTAEAEGDDYLFGRWPTKRVKPLQVHLLARVGDSDVLNEVATVEQVLEVEEITDENRTDADSPTAVERIQIDMAAALRACADEIDRRDGTEREPNEERADLIERMRVAYTEAWEAEDARQAQARRDGTWASTSKPHVRSRAGIVAALEALEGRR